MITFTLPKSFMFPHNEETFEHELSCKLEVSDGSSNINSLKDMWKFIEEQIIKSDAIYLEGTGGFVNTAIQLANLINKHDKPVFVIGDCYSAHALIIMYIKKVKFFPNITIAMHMGKDVRENKKEYELSLKIAKQFLKRFPNYANKPEQLCKRTWYKRLTNEFVDSRMLVDV